MGMEKFLKRIGRNVVLGAGLVAAGLSQQEAKAGTDEIYAARAKQIETDFAGRIRKAPTPDKKADLEDEKARALAKLERQKAEAKDADEKKASRLSTPSEKIGADKNFRENKADKKYVLREVDVLDEKGNKIGTVTEGSEAYVKLRELQIKKETGVEKERARNQLFFPGDLGGFNNWQNGINSGGEVNTNPTDGGYVTPYDSTRWRGGGRSRRNR